MLKTILIIFVFLCATEGGEIRIPESFEADFVQKVSSSKKKTIVYKGEIRMTRPGIFKWIYISPTKKEVCSNGRKVVVVDHDLEQISTYTMSKELDMLSVLSEAKHYKDNLYLAKYKGKSYTIAVDKRGYLEQIAYRDDLDNIVNIHFYSIKYGSSSLPSDMLKCRYPKEYDRIEG